MSIAFQSPKDARAKIETLKANKRSIEIQLAEQVKTRKEKRISANQYKAWRDNALKALHATEEELRYAQSWLSAYVFRVEAGQVAVKVGDSESVVAAAYFALRRLTALHEISWTEAGVGDEDVFKTMQVVQRYVQGSLTEDDIPQPRMPAGMQAHPGKKHRVQRPRISRD